MTLEASRGVALSYKVIRKRHIPKSSISSLIVSSQYSIISSLFLVLSSRHDFKISFTSANDILLSMSSNITLKNMNQILSLSNKPISIILSVAQLIKAQYEKNMNLNR